MLKNTFCHIQGISSTFECSLWISGIRSWDDFFLRKNDTLIKHLPQNKMSRLLDGLKRSMECVEREDYSFFKSLPRNQHWRVYDSLRHKACFLDIETTGLSKDRHDVTLVGIHSAMGTKIFMNGKNLEDFKSELEKYDVIVTFNGSCFDLPFLKYKFPDLNLDKFHLDLRFLMARLGYRGGLKRVEVDLGISRDGDLEGVDGFEAVRLWYRYKKGDLSALIKLEKYLRADVENLRFLMDFAYDALVRESFLRFKKDL
jgi:uncharacterized protein YprB with RNaseH-like and TPR domain